MAEQRYRRIAIEEAFSIPEISEANRIAVPRRGPPSPAFQLTNERLLDLGEGRLKAMDEDGIAVQLIHLTAPGVQNLEPQQAKELAALSNDRLAEACRKHPTRFAGYAACAPQDPEAAAQELQRGVRTLGLKGAIINSHTKGEYLDDKKFWPIFESLQALDVPLYLHPRDPAPSVIGSNLPGFRVGWGFAVECGTHVLRLINSGVFDQFPKLKLVVGHMAEGIPFYLPRLDNRYLWEVEAGGLPKWKRLPSEYFNENVWVCTSGMNYAQPLTMTLQTVGADRILFAVDYPYEVGRGSVKAMDEMPISEVDKNKIYHLNTERLFKL
jgi:5-carboxyvanillate decarboxylase